MVLGLPFEPSRELKRVLALPQIDQEGNVYANAYDWVGIAPRGQKPGPAAVFPAHILLDPTDPQTEILRARRDQAPSPEKIYKPSIETAEVALAVVPGQPPQAGEGNILPYRIALKPRC